MKPAFLIAFAILLAAFAPALVSAPTHAKTMEECTAQWREMKASGQTSGVKYRDFSKQCMSGEAAAALPPPAAEPAAKPSGGRTAMVARLRACAAGEWRKVGCE